MHGDDQIPHLSVAECRLQQIQSDPKTFIVVVQGHDHIVECVKSLKKHVPERVRPCRHVEERDLITTFQSWNPVEEISQIIIHIPVNDTAVESRLVPFLVRKRSELVEKPQSPLPGVAEPDDH